MSVGTAAGDTPDVWVWVDSAASCNLSCALCYTIPMQSKAYMSLDTFRRVVANVAAARVRVQMFHLNWRGEPALNPKLPEMLSLLAPYDWTVEWHTNGTVINADRARRIVEANRRQSVFFSLDGGDASTFEANRGEGTWPKALAGVEALVAARGDNAWPRIGIYQLDLGLPSDRYDPRFVELTSAVDEYVVSRPVGMDGESLAHRGSLNPAPRGPCFWLGHTLAVDHRGDVFTCLLRNGTRLGSAIDEGVDELVARARDLRSRVQTHGRRAVPGCSTCLKCEGRPHELALARNRS